MTADLVCSRSWQVSTSTASAPPASRPAASSLVGVAQRRVRRVAERRQLGAGADRAEHEARPVRRRVARRRPRGRAGRRPRPARGSGRRCRTRRGWRRLAPKVLVSTASAPDREVGVVDAARRRPGRVTLRISLQPSRPSKSSSGQVGGLQHRAHRPVGDHRRSAEGGQEAGDSHARGHGREGYRARRRPRVRHPQAGRASTDGRRPARPAPGGRRLGRVTEFEDWPELTAPVLIAAFEGWNDAGDAATAARGAPRADLGRDAAGRDRPGGLLRLPGHPADVSLVDGVTRRIEWPTTRLSVCRPPGADRRRRAGARASSRTCGGARSARSCSRSSSELGVTKVITARRAATDTPHTRPDAGQRHLLRRGLGRRDCGVEPTRYEGPTGIVGVFQDACVRGRHPGDLVLGVGAALRRRSRRTRRRPWRCCTGSRRSSTSRCRWARCPSRPTSGRARREMAEEDDEVPSTSAQLEERDERRATSRRGQRRRDRRGLRALPAPAAAAAVRRRRRLTPAARPPAGSVDEMRPADLPPAG